MDKKDWFDNMISTELSKLEPSPHNINEKLLSKSNKSTYNNILLFGFFIAGILQGIFLIMIGIKFIFNLHVGPPIILSGLFIINSTVVLYVLIKYKGTKGGIYI